MNPRLFKEQPGIMPSNGLLKWRDIIAATKALKNAGEIDVDGANITETQNGVVIQAPINRDAGSTPFDAVIGSNGSAIQTRITPGFLFAGTSFLVPKINGRNMLSAAARWITGAPKNIYIKVSWRPIIANDTAYNFAGGWSSRDSVRFPQGIELLDAEIVCTNKDSPHEEGWTSTGEAHVPAIIRRTIQSDGTTSAELRQDGEHFERIAQRNPEWQQGDPIADIYLSSQEAVGGGYGIRVLAIIATGSTTSISTGPPTVDDIKHTLVFSGISMV